MTEGLINAVSLPHLHLQQVVNQVNHYKEGRAGKGKKESR